ncbi:MAG: Maf family protein [Chromatiales bacterium]|jgi:septum formation protein
MPQIVLASASPRRRALLEQIGVSARVVPVDIDESRLGDEAPRDWVSRLALEKARAGRERVGATCHVLGADTLVVLGDRVFGKPRDGIEACDMLAALSGRTHEVLSAVALVGPGHSRMRLSVSAVSFVTLDDERIRAYWETGEPADKAGAYAIQGLGAVFVERLEGSYSGVMGLPLHETAELLSELGMAIPGPTPDT